MMQSRLLLPTSPGNLLPLRADLKSKAVSLLAVCTKLRLLCTKPVEWQCVPNLWIGNRECDVIFFLVWLCFCSFAIF